MADNITLSLLMQDSYNGATSRGGTDIKALGFVALDEGKDIPGSGFQAQAYVNTATQEIVYAIAGTNDLISGDTSADLAFGSSDSVDQQVFDALDYGRDISALVGEDGDYAGYTISTTGHSLGGGLAQVVSYTYGFDGMTWDSPRAGLVVESEQYNAYVDDPQNEIDAVKETGDLANYAEEGSLISSLPSNGEFLGTEQPVDYTDGVDWEYSALLIPFAPALGVATALFTFVLDLLEQHSSENSTDYFSESQNPLISMVINMWEEITPVGIIRHPIQRMVRLNGLDRRQRHEKQS